MHKRYIRIDLEYDMDVNPIQLQGHVIVGNIRRLIQEDMPYVKVLFTRDSGDRDRLNAEVGK